MGFSLFFYNLLLAVGVVLALPVIVVYLAVSKKARSGLAQKLTFYPPEFLSRLYRAQTHEKRGIWFHAVSVGEFNAIRPLIQEYQGHLPVMISTTTRTGQELARKTFPDLPVFYFPYDFRPLLHRALRQMKPGLVILTETEIWPNFIDVAARCHRIPVIMVNGRISPNSFRGYRKIRPLMQTVLHRFTHLYMQSEGDADRIRHLGAASGKVTVAGNIKFDMSTAIDPIQKSILRHLFSFTPQDTVLTFASTHSGEDQPLLETFMRLKKDFPELKLILAPRHPERIPEIRTILKAKMLNFSLRSELSETHPNPESVVVLDTIGELQTAFALSHIAVVGGSFVTTGGHNPLEGLGQKIPVLYGPHMFNFPDMARLIQEYQAGFQVEDVDGLADRITELLTQPEFYSNVVENGQRLLVTNRGAKEVLSQAIHQLVGTGV